MLIGNTDLSGRVIGCAIEVHHHLGPGLLESIYEAALCHELATAGIRFARQVPLPILYKSRQLDCGFVMDLIVENALVLEIKAVAHLLPVHEAKLLTCLKVSGMTLGLLVNFNEVRLKDGIRRRQM